MPGFQSNNADAQPAGSAADNVLAILAAFNGATFDRLRSAADNADALAVSALGLLRVLSAQVVFNGATFDRRRTPFVFKPLSAVAIATETAIWTPTAGKKFRLMGGIFSVGVAAANVLLKDNTAGTTIFVIPKSALDTPIAIPPLGNGILSGAVDRPLTATGVATSTLSGVVFGTEE